MIWKASLPNGIVLEGTASGSCQEAMSKAMMMDVPAGCRVDAFNESGKKIAHHNAGPLADGQSGDQS